MDTGRTRILTGPPGRLSTGSADWSPDGAYVVISVIEEEPGGGRVPVPVFAVPTAGGTARKITDASVFLAAWSPGDTHSLAYVSEDGALWLFDADSGVNRRLTADGSFVHGATPSFHDDGRIQIGNQLIDPETGDATVYHLNVSPDDAFTLTISPDGAYAVAADTFGQNTVGDIPACEANPSASSPQNHVFLYDLAADATTLLKDCDGRNFIFFSWLNDNRHLTMTGAECFACESPNRSIVLKDIETGAEVPLTDGYEFDANALVSPDGQKVLVTGDSLRIYDANGRLLRQIDPPDGFSVTGAAWAPDSDGFTYVIGPTGLWSA